MYVEKSLVEWLEDRFRDELRFMEGRQFALLGELRSRVADSPMKRRVASRSSSKVSVSEPDTLSEVPENGLLNEPEERPERPPSGPDERPEDGGNEGLEPKIEGILSSESERGDGIASVPLAFHAIKLPKLEDDDKYSDDQLEEHEMPEPQIDKVVVRPTLARAPSSLKESLARQKTKGFVPVWYPSRVVRSSFFEVFFSLLILLQAACLALETQYSGLDWGFKLSYEGYGASAQQIWPSVPGFLQATEMLFGTLFFVECLLRLCAYRWDFFCKLWNWFDFFLVLLWCFDTVLAIVPVDSPVIRLVRLVRLIRLVKLVRAVQGFDSLIVMTTALRDSVTSLFWVAIIMLVEMMFALLLNQVLVSLIFDAGHDYSEAEEKLLFEYFGTFLRAMLTMFQLTLGTWVPVARILQETVSPYFNIFTILHKVIIGFACIGVINGVFMQETLKVAQSDDIIMMREVANKERTHARKMKAFFRYADHSKDHVITKEEWLRVMSGPHAQHWFSAQGLKVKDASAVFKLLDEDGSNGISMDELIAGVAALQGPARSLDLANLIEDQRQLRKSMKGLLRRLDRMEILESQLASQVLSSSRNTTEPDSWSL